MIADGLGNPVTLEHPASLALVDDFVLGFIASESRVVNILQLADTEASPLVQAYLAALYMFAETGDAARHARPFIEKALASPIAATPREQRFVQAVAAWVAGDVPRAIALHEEQVRECPRDLVSLKLAHYHLFNAGDSPGMLRLALAAQPHAADVPHLHGMLAFAWEQCHFLEQAEAAARRAIGMRRKEPWAHHALAHVMLTQGRIAEGHAFLQNVSETWVGLNSFMVTHNWWHQALFAIERDALDEALAIHDARVWGVEKDYSQDQINAISLLARIELAGGDVGGRWRDVADHVAKRTGDQVLPFLDMQYLYGLARAGRTEADALMKNIELHARASSSDTWRTVCAPASRGLLAHARGDWSEAAEQLGQALPRMTEIGGSHAQRDLFAQVLLDALAKSGHHAAVQHLLQQQLRQQPESKRLKRQAVRAYAALGLPESLADLH